MGIYVPKTRPITRTVSKKMPLFTGAARPKYVFSGNVFDAALNRLRWLFDEFDNKITVANSGGKDSTVVVELALMVARERDSLPLSVTWLDQECEFQATVDYQRWMADRPEIDFNWYQIPFQLYNATNHDDPWLNVWGEGEEWVRPKEPDSIHDNDFYYKGKQVIRFKDVLTEINLRSGGGAILTGMRCEESPARRLFMTTKPAYKWVTWGSEGWMRPEFPPYWMFHPIYDWSYRDVWKAIYSNKWKYNTHYDTQFQYGVKVKNMRVSNYHHETALSALYYLQEAEPQTWEAATKRLRGLHTFSQQTQKDMYPSELPYMFSSWTQYLEHLIEKLVPKEEYREVFRKQFHAMQKGLPLMPQDQIAQVMCGSVIGNDLYGTTTDMFMVVHRAKERKKVKDAVALESSEELFTMGADE